MNRALVLIFLALLAACARAAPPTPLAAQSACPPNLPDVDRLACWVSAAPEPGPGERQPALLRDLNGNAVVGPNSPAPARNPDGSLVIGPKSSQ
jgi:hypothetical protein